MPFRPEQVDIPGERRGRKRDAADAMGSFKLGEARGASVWGGPSELKKPRSECKTLPPLFVTRKRWPPTHPINFGPKLEKAVSILCHSKVSRTDFNWATFGDQDP